MRKIFFENQNTFVENLKIIPGISNEDAIIIAENAEKIREILWKEGRECSNIYEYVKRFAIMVRESKEEKFKIHTEKRKFSEKTELFIIEPPCGSNTYIVCGESELLFIDCGFSCYRKEMVNSFKKLIENFENKKKILVLTHCDIDHAGICDIFDEVYMSYISKENFVRESKGERGYREENPKHRPYRKIAEIITEYIPPDINKIKVFNSEFVNVAEKTDEFYFEDIIFSVISGNGGHVQGEIMLVAEKEKTIFTGDVFVNTKSYTKQQKNFSDIALYLVPSVNQNSQKALKCREHIMKKYKGYLACPGHGMWCVL